MYSEKGDNVMKESVIACIKEALAEKLEQQGFAEHEQAESERRICEQWIRDHKWKLEIFSLRYGKCDPYYVDMGVHTDVRTDSKIINLSGTTVSYLAGKGGGFYRFPTLFLSLRIKGFVNTITEDTEKALSWFYIFDTPEKCIEEILAERAHVGTRGSDRYNLTLEFLNKTEENKSYSASGLNPADAIVRRWLEIFCVP